MIESYLLPYLYRSQNNTVHTTYFETLKNLNELNIKARPEILDYLHKYGKFQKIKLDMSDNTEPLFLSSFSNQVVDALAGTDLPMFIPYTDLTKEQQDGIYDVKEASFNIIQLKQQPFKPHQMKKLALLGMNTTLPVMCMGEEVALFEKLELSFELIHQIDCWSFKFNLENSRRNVLSIFDRKYMDKQNYLANDLLGIDLGIFSFLFNQKVRGDFAKRLDNVEDFEIEIHESAIADDLGNLFFVYGYQPSIFKKHFFQLLDQGLLASPFLLNQFFDTKNDYKVIDVKHKSNSLIPYMLLYFAIFQHEALDDIDHLFYKDSDVSHQTILQMIFSKFEGYSNVQQPLLTT